MVKRWGVALVLLGLGLGVLRGCGNFGDPTKVDGGLLLVLFALTAGLMLMRTADYEGDPRG